MSVPGITAEGDAAGGSRPTSGPESVVRAVRANCKRWTRKSVRNPSAALLELALGVFALLMFTAVFGDVARLGLARTGFGDVEYVTFVLPAVLVQVSMSTGLSSGLGLVEDLQTGMFEKVVVSPMSWTAVFAGKALAELGRVVVHLLVLLGIGTAMGATISTGLPGVVGILAVCLLFSLWYTAVSNVLALLTRDEETLDAAGNLLLFPLLFLSSGFLPTGALPDAVQTFARFNPVTYAVDAVRAIVLGRDVSTAVEVTGFGGVWNTLVPSLAVLVALNVVFGGLAVALLARASSAGVE